MAQPGRHGRPRDRGRLRRALRAAPAAGPRLLGAGARGGRRGRRHLVLEPLPRRPLRLRELLLLLLVRPRARAGVALERALPPPARDPRLPRARRGPPRPAP